MVFMTRKNMEKLGEFLGAYSVLMENANAEQWEKLLDDIPNRYMSVLAHFRNAQIEMKKKIASIKLV